MPINHGTCQAGHEWYSGKVSTWQNYVPQVAHLLLAQPYSLSIDDFIKWVLIIFIRVEINDGQLGSFCSKGEADQLTTSDTHVGDEMVPSISFDM